MWSVSPPVSSLVERTTRVVRPKDASCLRLLRALRPAGVPVRGVCVPPPARSLPCRERCCSTSLNAVSLVSYFPWYFFSFSRYIVTFRRPTRNGARGSRPDPVPGTKDVPIIRLAIFPTSPSFLYPLFVLFLHLTTYPSTRLQQYFSSEADFKSRQHTIYQ